MGAPARANVALLAQEPLLFPHLDVRGQRGLRPAQPRGAPGARPRTTARRGSPRSTPTSSARADPAQLSGGQAQRVALARALAADPDLLLLDEPLAALDVEVAAAVRQTLRRVLAGRTAIIVTHDVLDAVLLADRIAVLEAGRVVESGTTADGAAPTPQRLRGQHLRAEHAHRDGHRPVRPEHAGTDGHHRPARQPPGRGRARHRRLPAQRRVGAPDATQRQPPQPVHRDRDRARAPGPPGPGALRPPQRGHHARIGRRARPRPRGRSCTWRSRPPRCRSTTHDRPRLPRHGRRPSAAWESARGHTGGRTRPNGPGGCQRGRRSPSMQVC